MPNTVAAPKVNWGEIVMFEWEKDNLQPSLLGRNRNRRPPRIHTKFVVDTRQMDLFHHS